MKFPSLPQWLTLALATFGGAFVASLQDNPLTVFSDRHTAYQALAGAAFGGVAAVAHLYQTAPADKAIVEASK